MRAAMKIRKLSKHFPILSMGLLAGSFLYSGSAFAQVDADVIAELRAQIAALSSRLEQLEGNNQEINTTLEENTSSLKTIAWTERVKIGGDIRPRFEHIDNELTASDRNRNRIRVRLNVNAKINEDWSTSIGMSSGSDDPISTNQTLGGGGGTKDLRLDLAYITYNGFENTSLTAGKYKNVFFKPGGQNMIFDGDYRPEGLGIKYENNALFLNAATMILEGDDNFNKKDKETMFGLQVGYEIPLNDDASMAFGASYFDASVAGSKPFFLAKGIAIPYGNTVDSDGHYVYNYEEVEIFAEANFTLAGRPLRLFGDYVTNLDADEFDTGWVLGVKYGKASTLNTWEFRYNYQHLEADAVLGSLTDSDFGGGGTDNEGHIIRAAYGLGGSTKLGLTYFINKYGEARLGEKIDYNRLQLDIATSF